MRGLSDLDSVCLGEIFKNLRPLDLCSMRQCSKRLRNFVDDQFYSLYFVREQWLDLTLISVKNAVKILNNFNKFVRYLKVGSQSGVVATRCGDTMKGLSLVLLQLQDIKKFAGLDKNLEILEIRWCDYDQKCIENILLGHEYPNLTTFKVEIHNHQHEVTTDVLKKFFMTKRSIKKLKFMWIRDDILPLMALNATELEELDICLQQSENAENMMSLAQLRKLKCLEIGCNWQYDERSIIELIKELSLNTQLDMLGIYDLDISEEFYVALSKLTLKELRLMSIKFPTNCTKSIEALCRKLSKLESLVLNGCFNFPYRKFLASVCELDKLRTMYVWASVNETNNFIEQIVKDYLDGRGHRCIVLGDPLCIYLLEDMFDRVKGLLTQDNLKSIEKYGNIKIFVSNGTLESFTQKNGSEI